VYIEGHKQVLKHTGFLLVVGRLVVGVSLKM
jgi:hypothetical protein